MKHFKFYFWKVVLIEINIELYCCICQGLSKQELYSELLRNCFLGLIDASGSQDELKWAAFTFLKVKTPYKCFLHGIFA